MDNDGYSPLHYACITRQNDIISVLAEAGADASMPDANGLSPLHWSAMQLEVWLYRCVFFGALVTIVDNSFASGARVVFS
jgi:hypothetical protein